MVSIFVDQIQPSFFLEIKLPEFIEKEKVYGTLTGSLLKGFFSFQPIANLNKSNKGALKDDGFIPVFKLTHNVIKSFLKKNLN